MPMDTPVTMPPVTVAEGKLLLQIPPLDVSDNVIGVLMHTFDGPVIVPAKGSGLIVTRFVAMAVPQLFVTVYLIVSIPVVTPVTTSPDKVTMVEELLHDPPEEVSTKVMEFPTQTELKPVIVPADGNGFTVINFTAVVLPYRFVTV